MSIKMKRTVICGFGLLMLSMGLTGCKSSDDGKTILSSSEDDTDESSEYEVDEAFDFNENFPYDNIDYSVDDFPYEDFTYHDEMYGDMSEETFDETEEVFASYDIEIQRNKLGVYDEPGYNTGNWLYDITDRRTITIVEEREIYENGCYRQWGKINTGGWVSLTAAYVVDEDDITEEITDNIAETDTADNGEQDLETTPSNSGLEASSEDEELAYGTLVDEFNYIYGCGDEHSKDINGLTFHWYDRYEKRDKNNTMVFSYFDIISFEIMRVYNGETTGYEYKYNIDYEVEVSSGAYVDFRWSMYNGDYYVKEAVMTGDENVRRLCKGTAFLGYSGNVEGYATYLEFSPLIHGNSN